MGKKRLIFFKWESKEYKKQEKNLDSQQSYKNGFIPKARSEMQIKTPARYNFISVRLQAF